MQTFLALPGRVAQPWLRTFLLVTLLALPGAVRLRAGDFAARFERLRQTATPAQLYAFLYDLPKGGDLHHHTAGAGWPEDWLAIATDPARNGGNTFYTRTGLAHYDPTAGVAPVLYQTIQQSSYDKLTADQRADYTALAELAGRDRTAWLSGLRLDLPGEGREEFFEVIWPRLGALIHDPQVVAELMVQNLQRFGAEGVRYLEAQVPLFSLADRAGRPLDPDTVTAIYEERLSREDARATGVEVRFQQSVSRFKPGAEREIEETYAFIDRHRARWVGVNFAGREDRTKGFPLRFLEPLRRMRRQYSGVGLSIHAGESDEPDRHVHDALLLGATRIGHGVNLINDPETMLLMRGQPQLLVEVNLISNRLLEYTPDLTKHPFPEYLRFGIPVCLNTDDRGMWGSDLTDEYYTAVTLYRLTWPEIVTLGRNSLSYGFMEPELKTRLLADYDRRVAEFERRYAGDDWTTVLPREVVRSWYAEHNFGLK